MNLFLAGSNAEGMRKRRGGKRGGLKKKKKRRDESSAMNSTPIKLPAGMTGERNVRKKEEEEKRRKKRTVVQFNPPLMIMIYSKTGGRKRKNFRGIRKGERGKKRGEPPGFPTNPPEERFENCTKRKK